MIMNISQALPLETEIEDIQYPYYINYDYFNITQGFVE